jgi:hypothetical protein
MGPAEPIYVLTSQNPSPQNRQTNVSQRNFSEPVTAQTKHPVAQRAFSDSPAGRGIDFEKAATPIGRRASTNDVASRPNYVEEASPQKSHGGRSNNSIHRPAVSNDARVLEAMEKQHTPEFLVKRPVEPTSAPRNIQLHQSVGTAGAIHTYFYSSNKRLSHAEQHNHSVFVSGMPYELFENHALKGFMSQCGEVDNIKFLAERGHAFVA